MSDEIDIDAILANFDLNEDPPILEGETYVGWEHPETSHAAAMDPGVIAQATSDVNRCLALITEAGAAGCTADEISEVLERGGRICPPNQVSSRVKQLVDEGLVRDSGFQRVTRRGRRAIVWEEVTT